MNDHKNEREKIGRVWRAGRLLIGKTQKELALELKISQSNISKIESAQLEPSASDWYNYCELVGIDSHKSYALGYIDGRKKFKNRLYHDSFFKMPIRYRGDFSLKVRELVPFRTCVLNELGEKRWSEFLERAKVVDEMFFVYDFQLSLNFLNDMAEWALSHGLKLFDKAKSYTSDFSSHGTLKFDYSRKISGRDLLKELVLGQQFYQRVFLSTDFSEAKGIRAHFKVDPEFEDIFEEADLSRYMTYKIDSFREIIKSNLKEVPEILKDKESLSFDIAI